MTEILQGDVKVPGIGKTKKLYVYGGLGIAGAYVAWRWWSASQSTGDSATVSDGLYTTPDQSEYGLSTTGGATSVTGNTGSTVTDGTSSSAVNSNSDWTNKAAEILGSSGYDSATVYAALGEFLDRRALDKAEATIARAALAAVGQPPTGGPFSVIEEATTGGTGTMAAPQHLRSGGAATTTTVPLAWDTVSGANGYRVYRGTGENIGHSVDGKFTATGLQPGTSYHFSVAALNSSGKAGKRSSTYTGKTAKPAAKPKTTATSSSTTKSTSSKSSTAKSTQSQTVKVTSK